MPGGAAGGVEESAHAFAGVEEHGAVRRRVENDRLNHAGYLWAFSAITASPGAKAHYRRRRDHHGDWHAAPQRNLFNRMIGQLYQEGAGTAAA
ncbi:hypothetical protein F4556_000257 [Kitasatospora gansuensis]|uniref:Uncharacterized protein n=1 Tax=Kitasatospora gansuensis TaxID=258050 RepID=A0A7W7S734_9ACTN|nr:hypothetical protein [Kitasatospora gansuensis]